MAVTMMNVVRTGICVLSVLFCILAMALPNWIVTTNDYTDPPGKTHTGLWKSCDKEKDKDEECSYISEGAAIQNLTRAMVSIAMFLLFAALLCSIISFIRDNTSTLGHLAGALSAISGLCLLVAFAATADYKSVLTDDLSEKSKVSYAYGAAFALDIIAWLLACVQAVLFLIQQGEYSDPSGNP